MVKPFRILIVDDVPDNLQVLGNMLEPFGYDLFFATDGMEALETVKNYVPDLILLDIMMPKLDGLKLCRFLKLDKNTIDIPIIFLTAKSQPEDVVKGFEAGAVDYISKPFNRVELLSRVKTHLELGRVRSELKISNSDKDKFFSIIAHDLRNPATSLLVSAEFLVKNYDEMGENERKGYVEDNYNSAHRLVSLLDQLLHWANIQRGKIPFKPLYVSLQEIINECFLLLKSRAEQKNISLISELSEDISILADKNMLLTIVRNLVTNSLKFTSDGGVISMGANEHMSDTEIWVKDTGVGISEENQKKIFNLNSHVSTTGTAQEKGSGLGLIICKEFVEKHNGAIWVKSTLGKGSAFHFTLPKES